MIEAEHFAQEAYHRGLRFWTSVPCFHLAPLIDCVTEHPELRHVCSANEGDAVATAAGATLGGQGAVVLMQNSGLGNALNPLASLNWVFRVPALLVVTLRGDPEIGDEPQHELMGSATTRILDDLQIPWEPFPAEGQVEGALDRAVQFMKAQERPFAFVLRPGALAPRTPWRRPFARTRPEGDRACLHGRRAPGGRPSRADALRRVIAATPTESSLVIATTGYTGRELHALSDRPNQLYMVGSMGCASSLGLGLSLVRGRLRVVIVDGDGALLMRMGNLATLGAYAGPNLVHIVLDNEAHESTGGQATASSGVSFARIASACGYALALEGDDPGLLDDLFRAEGVDGPRLAHLKIRQGAPADLPRPSTSPLQVRTRLVEHIRRIDGEADGRR
jgi:phosphonopyruvate decarboxylase